MRKIRSIRCPVHMRSTTWDSASLVRKSATILRAPASQRLFLILGMCFLIASLGTAALPFTSQQPPRKTNSFSHEFRRAINVPSAVNIAEPELKVSGIVPHPGKRAVALSVDARAGVEGYAQPGSLVDVYYTYVDTSGRLQSTILADGARVLAAQGKLFNAPFQPGVKSQPGTGTVVLEVSPDESMKIITGTNVALISLVLRSADDTKPTTPQIATSEDVVPLTSKYRAAPKQRAYCPPTPGSGVPIGTPLLPSGYRVPAIGASQFHQCRPLSVL